jgi:hypothetical protein
MGTELPTEVTLGQTLVLIQMTFLNNIRKVGRLVLSRTTCYNFVITLQQTSSLYNSTPPLLIVNHQQFPSLFVCNKL